MSNTAPPAFHLMAKPTGAVGNLDCAYDIMGTYAAADARRGRNDPCTCGSGRRWKHRHQGAARTAVAHGG